MTDIVDRLRFTQCVSMAGTPLDMPREDPLSLEAADEIERLRDERKELRDALERLTDGASELFAEDFYEDIRVAREVIAKAKGEGK